MLVPLIRVLLRLRLSPCPCQMTTSNIILLLSHFLFRSLQWIPIVKFKAYQNSVQISKNTFLRVFLRWILRTKLTWSVFHNDAFLVVCPCFSPSLKLVHLVPLPVQTVETLQFSILSYLFTTPLLISLYNPYLCHLIWHLILNHTTVLTFKSKDFIPC